MFQCHITLMIPGTLVTCKAQPLASHPGGSPTARQQGCNHSSSRYWVDLGKHKLPESSPEASNIMNKHQPLMIYKVTGFAQLVVSFLSNVRRFAQNCPQINSRSSPAMLLQSRVGAPAGLVLAKIVYSTPKRNDE